MNKNQASSIVVVIAALNEEVGLGPTLDEIMRFSDRPYILVVDGNSTDATVGVARKRGLDVVVQEGKGKGCAMGHALSCLKTEPQLVVFIDADFTYPAEYIPDMIRILEEKPEIGMVCGNRFDKPFAFGQMNSTNYVGNRLLALAQYLMNGIRMRDPLTGLRVVRWEILKGWKPKSKGFDFEVELNYLVQRKGFRILEIPIHYRERLGEKKLRLRHGFTILARILSESMQVS